MNSKELVADWEIKDALEFAGFTGCTVDNGRLKLIELLTKAGAGYRNSHTEENYLKTFGLMQNNRLPNKRGRRFICSMVYAASNKKPDIYNLIKDNRI